MAICVLFEFPGVTAAQYDAVLKNLTGGYSVESASNKETGFGTVTGTFNKNTGAVSIKLTGPITTP